MNSLEYLNHISQSNRPTKPVKQSKITGGLILRILVIGVVITAILMGVGILMNTGSNRATNLTKQLYVRMVNTNKTISTYNKKLKSSQLRAISYSLSSTLTGATSQLSAYLTKTYPNDATPLSPDSETATTEASMSAGINSSLEKARLNGLLDRDYATKIHLQVSLIMSMITELMARDTNPELREILTTIYSNLNTIEQSFQTYADRNG